MPLTVNVRNLSALGMPEYADAALLDASNEDKHMSNQSKAYSATLLASLALVVAVPAHADAAKVVTTVGAPALAMDEHGQMSLAGLTSDQVLQDAYSVSSHEVKRLKLAEVNLHCPRNTNCGDKCGGSRSQQPAFA